VRRWLTVLVVLGLAAPAMAQNPVTIQQLGTATPVTTTLPVSGTVTANAGSGTFNIAGTVTATLDAVFTGRFPSGASPANGESNTNTNLSRIGVYQFIFNGATWDRWTGAVTNAGTFAVQASQTGTWNIGTVTTATVTQATGTNLHMVCDSGCSSSAGFADNSAFTYGTTAVNPIAGVLDDVSTNSATENSAAVVRITALKGLHVNLRNNAGTEIGTSGTPLRIDPTGTTTEPVAGTGTAGTPAGGVLTIQGVTSMTKLLVTPDSVALPANQSVNVAQLAGTTTDTNSGNKSAGTLRTVIATDQPNLTTPLNINESQINGVTVTMGAGATGTGVQRVNDVASSATGAAPPASAIYVGGLSSGATGGFLGGIPVCDTVKPVSMTSATTTLMVTGVASRNVHICAINLVTALANNVAVIEGTGATCGTNTSGMAGGSTAANGWNFAAR
jgi:hypothetical protein